MRGSFSHWESHKCDFIVKTHEISTPSIRLVVGSSIDLYPRIVVPPSRHYNCSQWLFLFLLSRPFFPLIADLERFFLTYTWKINHSSCSVAWPLHYESTWEIIPKQHTNLVSISERLRGLTFSPSDRACSCKKIVHPFCSDCLGSCCISGLPSLLWMQAQGIIYWIWICPKLSISHVH